MSDSSSTARVVSDLRDLVGQLDTGSRLPSTRSLCRIHQVGPVTVQSAVQQLAAEGLIDTRPGSGNFVAQRRREAAVDLSWQTTLLGPSRVGQNSIGSTLRNVTSDVIALHGGYPEEALLPVQLVRSALTRAARGPDAILRPPLAGLPALRDYFARSLGADRPVQQRDVLITAGGQGALASTFRALTNPGDSVIMESPTYWGALAAARQAGLTIVPIARGVSAPSPDDVRQAMEFSRARIVYVQPNFANPTGAQWTSGEASSILAVVEELGGFLVEDDWAHDFGIDTSAAPVAARDTDGHVIYIRSVSKSLSPSMRIAAVVGRGPVLRRIETDSTVDDLYVSGVLQSAALDILTRPAWTTHRNGLRGSLRDRRDSMVTTLKSVAPDLELTQLPKGGLNLWYRLPDSIEPNAFAARCLTAGLAISSGTEWFPAEAPASYIRLNFGGCAPDRYPEAAHILADNL